MKTRIALLAPGCLRAAVLTLATLLSAAGVPAADLAPSQPRFYIQLLRGSNDPTAPSPDARLVGAKVQKQLQPVFRWKNYWEVQRTNVVVAEGRIARTDLTSGHSLEIDLGDKEKRTIRLYEGKKLVRTAVCARDKEFCIQGIERKDGSVWFLVVRSDPPAT